MRFSEFTRAIAGIGRAVNPDTLAATRKLIAPLLPAGPLPGVRILRDLHYGSDERRRLDLFTPEHPEPRRPLLVFVHGGGFTGGDKHMPGTPFYDNIGNWAVAQGCNAVNLTYRLAPAHQWPSAIEDLAAAVRFLQTQGGKHGIGAERIFLMGQSAGAAHVASYVAHPEFYAPAGHGLAGIILLSGLYNYASLPIGPLEQSYLGMDASQYAQRSSLAGLLRCDLPMLVTLAEHDPPQFEQQGLELLTALQLKHRRMPRFVHMIGHNHLSVALYLGLEGDLLAPQLLAFIRDTDAGQR